MASDRQHWIRLIATAGFSVALALGACSGNSTSGTGQSITTSNGTGSNLSLTVNNASGLALIQSAWGM
jgi:hypothetical protein